MPRKLVCKQGKSVFIYDYANNTTESISTGDVDIKCVLATSNGQYVVAGGKDHLFFYSTASKTVQDHSCEYNILEIQEIDSNTLLVVSETNLLAYSMNSNTLKSIAELSEDGMTKAIKLHSSDLLVAHGENFHHFDSNMVLRFSFSSGNDLPFTALFENKSQGYVTGLRCDRQVVKIDFEKGTAEEMEDTQLPKPITDIRTLDNGTLVAAYNNGDIVVIGQNLTPKPMTPRFKTSVPARILQIDPNVLACLRYNSLYIWDAVTGKCLKTMLLNASELLCII
jgi:WD40 repeat protein